MKKAVSSAQSCIDMCCSQQNIAVVSAQYISDLSEFLDILDPSGIDFTKKGFFSEMKIKKYWEIFSRYYTSVTTLVQKLKQSRIVTENTLTTLRNEQESYRSKLEEFLSLETEEADSEYLAQKSIALNLNSVLDNTVSEYSVLSERIKNITEITSDVFENAVLIARVNYQINIITDRISLPVGNPDVDSFKRGFEKLSHLCV
ncbi:MAG: hypothetical protein PUE12_17535 [Oscillospiraceae bacterium]|nr:hypothetical protein [Oscillospiraceae bacterium]